MTPDRGSAAGAPGGTTGGSTGGHGKRFPGYRSLDRRPHWDAVTAAVVTARVAGPRPPLRLFTPAEEAAARALLNRLLDDPPVDLLPMIDARLAERETDGWHYADLPPDDRAWPLTLRALDEDAGALPGRSPS
ncbi:hypothetical protein [Streptomyces sp. TLI_171]|uniref:hypothetical protein n=1 Tax=Streptomyces sp. TLI_171 TaxID=1938859 RepID=UPI000C19B93D|nr:hypothetical protein [Streptomyces sp. TLI_171]RKE17481.1 hypothetical protein BX266_0739 [Streptomyces sp. TLI_171]